MRNLVAERPLSNVEPVLQTQMKPIQQLPQTIQARPKIIVVADTKSADTYVRKCIESHENFQIHSFLAGGFTFDLPFLLNKLEIEGKKCANTLSQLFKNLVMDYLLFNPTISFSRAMEYIDSVFDVIETHFIDNLSSSIIFDLLSNKPLIGDPSNKKRGESLLEYASTLAIKSNKDSLGQLQRQYDEADKSLHQLQKYFSRLEKDYLNHSVYDEGEINLFSHVSTHIIILGESKPYFAERVLLEQIGSFVRNQTFKEYGVDRLTLIFHEYNLYRSHLLDEMIFNQKKYDIHAKVYPARNVRIW